MTPPLPTSESLRVEFKSDRKRLADGAIVEAVVCMANAEGGTIYLGVEDDGALTGLHAERALDGLQAMVANRTSPSVSVLVEPQNVGGTTIARITVPLCSNPVATSDGLLKRRRLNTHGEPECVPFLPAEIPSRLSDLGALDVSAQPVAGATLDDLDPVERARLRQFIERFNGDRTLLDLSDDELDGVLGLVTTKSGSRVPTLAGLLLIGREATIRRLVPTHEVAFQVLDGEEVRFNEFRREPLLRIFEWLELQFSSRNPEEEIQVGLFRVGVPRVDRFAFREAIANALVHRDYARIGAVHVLLNDEQLRLSNPGGFVAGVTPQNILTVMPRPRNPTLADAFKRIGLVERTGRGVDRIYRQTVRYGRPTPSYMRSTSVTVDLEIPAADADLEFLRMILVAEEEQGGPLPVDSLIALACIRTERRVSVDDVATAIQKDRSAAKKTVEGLLEAGLVEAHGNTRARVYTFSSLVYRRQGKPAAYTRQAGYDRVRQEQMVVDYARQHGQLSRADVVQLCRLTTHQASHLLKRLVEDGRLTKSGTRRWTTYSVPDDHREA